MNGSNQIYHPTSALAGVMQTVLNAGGDFTDLEIEHAVLYLTNSAGEVFPLPLEFAKPDRMVWVQPRPQLIFIRKKNTPYGDMTPLEKLAFGERVYAMNCVMCHKADGAGGGQIPALNSKNWNNNAALIETVMRGSNHGFVPGFRHLKDEEIAEVINFTKTEIVKYKTSELISPEAVHSRRRN
jgi:Cytochrome C oxidase, cbb3-type, subunit III